MTAGNGRRLLIDVTRTLESGLHTGIQRVVRGLYRGAQEADCGRRVLAVRWEGAQWRGLGALPAHPLEARPAHSGPIHRREFVVQPRPGDWLLLADASWYGEPWPAIDRLRAAGGRVAGLVHDLLPVTQPQWFRADTSRRFQRYLPRLLRHADLLMSPSEHVARQLRELPPRRQVSVLPLSGELQWDRGAEERHSMLPAAPYALMVATLEPRKGHELALDAFERLWARDSALQLILVGGAGWCTENLQRRLRRHRQWGRRLHWLESVDDNQLAVLYRQASVLLALSSDEGFGLPLAEATTLGCPVIATDIPPFREAAPGARYLQRGEPEALCAALLESRSRELPRSTRCWHDVSASLEALLAEADGSAQLLRRPAHVH